LMPGTAPLEEILQHNPVGLILSGGPASVFEPGAPRADPRLWSLPIPILGICYGMQLMVQELGGVVRPGRREYGRAVLEHLSGRLFQGLGGETPCWMSHGDSAVALPQGFTATARTSDNPTAAIEGPQGRFGVQFHPEVTHTPRGRDILSNFLDVCGSDRSWTTGNIVETLIHDVHQQVGQGRVLLGISGGLDSSTLALLLHRALGKRVVAVFVDHGLLRQDEASEVIKALGQLGVNLVAVDAAAQFLKALAGVEDPEQKRKIIGAEFIKVFEAQAARLGPFDFLAQGTLYPDVIESAGGVGAANIKSHHNVGGLPERLGFRLLEPFRTLFKDEVREIAGVLGLPEEIRWRHPFPGPGLAIRIVGAVTPERLAILRASDRIFLEILRQRGWYQQVSQALAVLLPVRSVGVMGDQRTYAATIVLRAVTTEDFMTADWARLPHELLAEAADRIVREVKGVNRVVYDITSKPPATVEWE
ncbi:MAG: glutamine-hydrolyzing GMP synthase, partial [Deinococcus sp.]|nr:glutamine-hydrolyzing GMP synthase [Deinococcus sp.]